MRLYAGAIRFFGIVLLVNVAVFALVAVLARRSRGFMDDANTLRLAGSAIQVRSLDPAPVGDLASGNIVDQLYEGLVTYDQKTLAVVPCLASSWQVSPDGKVYTFRLRRGVHFQDDPCFPGGRGREVTAEDFRYSLTRACDPVTLSFGLSFLKDRIVGAGEYMASRTKVLEKHPRFWEIKDAEGTVREVRGLRALDDHTFQIALTAPFAPFLKVLTMTFARAVPREAVERYGPLNNPPGKDSLFRHPVGTGPFLLEKWEPDVEIVLRANPRYWGRDEKGQALPHLSAVHMFSRRDPHTAFMEFEEDHADASGVPDQDWDRVMNRDRTLKQPYASRYLLDTSPTWSVMYYGFDMTQPPFGPNKKLRQALNYAIDRGTIVKEIDRGVGAPAYGPIPRGLPGYDPLNKRYGYNPGRAKELLAEAGYPDGKGLEEIVLYVSPPGDTPDRTSVAVLEQLRLIGVKVRLKQQPWPIHQEAIDKHQARFFGYGWIADYPDAEDFLQLFLSRNRSEGGVNASWYANPQFDRLYDQAMLERDDVRRAEVYRRAAAIIIDDCPWLFMTTDETVRLRQPRVQNDFLNAVGLYYFKNVILDRSGSPTR